MFIVENHLGQRLGSWYTKQKSNIKKHRFYYIELLKLKEKCMLWYVAKQLFSCHEPRQRVGKIVSCATNQGVGG
ncbi:MAG: hypothetical protein BGO53_05630 [Sphingobacteriales bacterium 39-19]|nr:MAG: hypothetical protein BGO53_05630 [Sphingobacteriales bacterium 39-19]